jgi:hypothetical protein
MSGQLRSNSYTLASVDQRLVRCLKKLPSSATRTPRFGFWRGRASVRVGGAEGDSEYLERSDQCRTSKFIAVSLNQYLSKSLKLCEQ